MKIIDLIGTKKAEEIRKKIEITQSYNQRKNELKNGAKKWLKMY